MADPASWGDGYRAGYEQACVEAKVWCQHTHKMTEDCMESDMLTRGHYCSCLYIIRCPYQSRQVPDAAEVKP